MVNIDVETLLTICKRKRIQSKAKIHSIIWKSKKQAYGVIQYRSQYEGILGIGNQRIYW